jgi:hypothetical protein
VKGLGAPATKLIESVQAAIGTLYEPTRIRREAKAKADAAIVMANTDAEIDEIAQRAAHRMAFQETRRQQNIEAVVADAQKFLPTAVSPEPVNSDWTSRFFDAAQDVSTEELRVVWSRLLAGEVAKPGSFSKRTLSVLRDLNAQDAKAFQLLRQIVWNFGEDSFVIHQFDWGETARLTGVSYGLVTALQDAGLLFLDPVRYTIGDPPTLQYFDRYVRFKSFQSVNNVTVNLLSQAGMELIRLIDGAPNDAYFNYALGLIRALNGLEVAP